MLDFEGNISDPHRRSNDLDVFENDNEESISELHSIAAPVTTNDQEDSIHFNVTEAFSVPPSSNRFLNPITDAAFCKTINLRG